MLSFKCFVLKQCFAIWRGDAQNLGFVVAVYLVHAIAFLIDDVVVDFEEESKESCRDDDIGVEPGSDDEAPGHAGWPGYPYDFDTMIDVLKLSSLLKPGSIRFVLPDCFICFGFLVTSDKHIFATSM